jgi:hypothetical protein
MARSTCVRAAHYEYAPLLFCLLGSVKSRIGISVMLRVLTAALSVSAKSNRRYSTFGTMKKSTIASTTKTYILADRCLQPIDFRST